MNLPRRPVARILWLLPLLSLLTLLRPVAGDPPVPGVDQKAVDAAIKKGADFLKGGYAPSDSLPTTELVLLTLLHAGVSINDPAVAAGLDYVKKLDVTKLAFRDKTYRISIAAMVLEQVNKDAFADKIAGFAQFLVCNQCENGQWTYGENIEGKVPGGPGERTIETGGGETGGNGGPPAPKHGQTRTQKRIPIKCDKPIGPKTGDHSNTQFALLGLRAAAESGVVMPKEVWEKSLHILEQGQKMDGGWGYTYPNALDAQGSGKVLDAGGSYGSMTCSGVCGLIICRNYLGLPWKADPLVVKALAWIGDNFTVKENAKMAVNPAPNMAGGGGVWHYYYLYGLERAGMIAGTEEFNKRKWYKNGAEFLIKAQQDNGSWLADAAPNVLSDTCFAILFLKRATHPVTTINSGK